MSAQLPTRARRCSTGDSDLNRRDTIERAVGPEILTIPNALRPGGVEIAAIVSSRETIFCSPSRMHLPCGFLLAGSILRRFRVRGRPVFVNHELLADAYDVAS